MSSGGCTGGDAPVAHSSPGVIRVPEDAKTIQQGLDAAQPGDLVLVGPGEYHESITMTKPRVVLRGVDRNTVVVDGDFTKVNGITVTGAQSVVENLTVRRFLANGVLFTGVTDQKLQGPGGGGSHYDPLDSQRFPPLQGFRASFVTAYNNALYGIYSFDARDGVIENSYASGQADSGIYVGQCRPCNTVVRDNLVEHNAVGIEVTNASENLWFLGNRAVRNRVGVTVNSNDFESLAPQHGAVLAGNTVVGNNDPHSPAQADGGFGIGIGIGGGSANTVARNLVKDNAAAGIIVSDVQGYAADGNTVTDSVVTGNGTDLVLTAAGKENRLGGSPGTTPAAVTAPPGADFRGLPQPPAQPRLPGGPDAPWRAAVGLPGPVDPGTYPLPAAP
ncbi:right-handed parallel beta-helix repeat-containing protein [Amycolatopsis azurea]|uniref:right-handed parallel beta-helix repeat-containing protein n=1 Tax=Amycolatopsis azurea TaxID=36819 RepID=UPI001178A706|nr:right-handed parallel beta-helix repeat-containing protein [Amycolatopsis azurea]